MDTNEARHSAAHYFLEGLTSSVWTICSAISALTMRR